MAEQLLCWRHPRAEGAAGRCIGRTELRVDRRRARRLAARIRATARRLGLPREVWVSPRERCRAVGRELRRWGFRVQVDARLAEMDFGRWDGLPWTQVPMHEVERWQEDFAGHAPGGGESLAALAARAAAFAGEGRGTRQLVTHGGWINALRLGAISDAARWPAPPPHARCVRCQGPWPASQALDG